MSEFKVQENFSSWWNRDVMNTAHELGVVTLVILSLPVCLVVFIVRKIFRRQAKPKGMEV